MCCSVLALFLQCEVTRGQTVVVAEKFNGVIAGSQGGVHVPVNGDAAYLFAGIFNRFSCCGGQCGAFESERAATRKEVAFRVGYAHPYGFLAHRGGIVLRNGKGDHELTGLGHVLFVTALFVEGHKVHPGDIQFLCQCHALVEHLVVGLHGLNVLRQLLVLSLHFLIFGAQFLILLIQGVDLLNILTQNPFEGSDFVLQFLDLCGRFVLLVLQFLKEFFHLGAGRRIFLHNRVVGQQRGLVLILGELVVERVVFVGQLNLLVGQLQLFYLLLLLAGFLVVAQSEQNHGCDGKHQQCGENGDPHGSALGFFTGLGRVGHHIFALRAAVGMALAARMERKDYRVSCIVGDGEQQEGQIWEAAMYAGSQELDNLVVLVDDNGMQIDDYTDAINAVRPLDKRWEAFGWATLCIDGHNFSDLEAALTHARTIKKRPTAIIMATVKGKGLSVAEGKLSSHNMPLSPEDVAAALQELQ